MIFFLVSCIILVIVVGVQTAIAALAYIFWRLFQIATDCRTFDGKCHCRTDEGDSIPLDRKCYMTLFIIHSKYFSVSDWLKPHPYFTITSYCWPNIEPMTSKVQPGANYWTDDVKMTSKVQSAADHWTVDRKKKLVTSLCYIWWPEKQRAKLAKLL